VATYDGLFFRTKDEQDLVRSDKYQSDYVWEGLNPFTGETVIVDGCPLNSYGPYMNDGLNYKDANATLVFGSDGKIYVETTTTVSKNAELLLSYGHLYWLDPAHWEKLPEETKHAILNYYKCDSPCTSRPIIHDTTESATSRPLSSTGTGHPGHYGSQDYSFSDATAHPRMTRPGSPFAYLRRRPRPRFFYKIISKESLALMHISHYYIISPAIMNYP